MVVARAQLRRWVGVMAALACAVACLNASPAGGHPHPRQLRVLQMNLCNSGAAACYTGRSVAQAAAVIRAESPDLVTLNEVCENDVGELLAVLAEAHRGGRVMRAFQAAVNRRTGDVVRCRNGNPYGIGILAYSAGPDRGWTREGGVYPMQQSGGEHRVWLCLNVVGDFYGCTTHLANATASVALAQCEYLLGTVIAAARRSDQAQLAIVGGDLNLGAAAAQPCLPSGYSRRDDGAVQQIMASGVLVSNSGKTIDMHGATDHPGLFVELEDGLPHTN
jgi:endonuclease/exonuclease/phosphatase family metal-dependent hydrolase